MNTLKNIIGVLILTLIYFSCKNETNPEVKTIEVETTQQTTKSVDPNATYAKAEFTIEGMTCAMGCAKTIEKKIGAMNGVKSAIVDFDRKLAMVEYDEAKVTPASLSEIVNKTGEAYKVSNMKTVEDFSTNKKECTPKCKPDCTKKGTANCKTKAESCNPKCANKTDAKKMACAKDCNKPCCGKKTNA